MLPGKAPISHKQPGKHFQILLEWFSMVLFETTSENVPDGTTAKQTKYQAGGK